MKTLAIIMLLALMPNPKDDYVLICVSPTAHAYHKKYENKSEYCKGLKACTHEIRKITKADALDMNRTPCGFCY